MQKRTSLSVKLIITMLLLVSGTLCLCWFLNQTLLEDYYIHEKKQSVLQGFHILEQAYDAEAIMTDSFDVPFENLCANSNLDILVINTDLVVLRSSSANVMLLQKQVEEMLRGGVGEQINQESSVMRGDNYTMVRQWDNRLQSEYLVLWGQIDDNCYVYMKTAVESIKESAMITNRFFIGVGVFGLLIGTIVVFFLARSIAHPIKELTGVSQAMSDLHFEIKYMPKRGDSREVTELGHHMNALSHALEHTITDLKNANNQLQQDIEKKEQIDEMRKEFLANVSHELKTPIALIQGYAEGLKEEVNEDTQSREYYCEVIMDEASKMNHMVKKLLTLNQLEFGNDVVEIVRFDITEMIAGVVQANQLLAQQADVQLVFEETEPAFVWGDEFKVEEVITNYLSNAFHHVAGEKKIHIYYEKKEDVLRICVANTGAQICEEELDKIWIKFYKVDKARTREYGGSGIGLSIVKAIMDSMHQKCGVKNLTNGVEFWLELENGCITD